MLVIGSIELQKDRKEFWGFMSIVVSLFVFYVAIKEFFLHWRGVVYIFLILLWALPFIFILFILGIVLEKAINKLLGVEKKKVSETFGKKVERWGRGIILVLALCTLPFFIMKATSSMKWFWILYLIVLLGFQSILEWKYLKNSKQYVTTLIFLILGIIMVYNTNYFISLFKV